MFPYSTLAHGLLTAKYADDHRFGERDIRPQLRSSPARTSRGTSRSPGRLAGLATAFGMTVTQLVLAWTLAQPGITAALTGPKKPEHIEDSAAAADRALSPDELRDIEAALAG